MKRKWQEGRDGWSRRDFLRAAGLVGAIAVAKGAAAQMSGASYDPRLVGAIDMHVHSAPDVAGRSVNDLELARRAKEMGMRGIVIKNHQFITNDRAYLVRQVVPEVEIFGGIVLNYTVGGLNPAAVEQMNRFTGGYGKIVWLPTFDAAHHRSVFSRGPGAGGIRIIDKGGDIVPELRKILRLVASADLVLATAHVSPQEVLAAAKAAKEEGVRRIVVSHAMYSPVQLSLEEMERCVGLGAFVEHVYVANLAGPAAPLAWMRDWRHITLEMYAQTIKALGAEHCILSTDLGQYLNPTPADGIQEFIRSISRQGISDEEIAWMVCKNPARLLGLEPL